MSKVVVLANESGDVVIKSKDNPEWGHVCVKQERMLFTENGFVKPMVLIAYIPGRVVDLYKFGWKSGQLIDGTIIFKESLTPFNKKTPEKDYKIAGNTGVICMYYDKPIYRKNIYTPMNNAVDILAFDNVGNVITHTNSEEIKAAYRKVTEGEDVTVELSSDDELSQS